MYDRIVVVTRRTRLVELIARFNTRGQARFYIERSAQGTGDFAEYEREHDAYERAVALVHRATEVGLPRHVIDRERRIRSRLRRRSLGRHAPRYEPIARRVVRIFCE